jgi:acyl carrier protein
LRRREGMSVESRVKEMIADELGLGGSEVMLESNLIENLGADSLDLIELLMDLEEEYNLEIPDADAEKMLTVGGVVAYIQEHTKEKHGKTDLP